MSAKSQKQANLMRAAAHGAQFPMAKKVRASMAPSTLKEFEHVSHPHKNLGHFLHPKKS